ncbi:MAG: RluA family pseudouridine synthase [Chloroflexi bacterium]|nr:RluA family pseudouridine synthase [Chloroflexota bacterium]MBP8057393.1 RluA family pseudouridine synthase [Chloroflexota bacterium]
MPRSTIEITLNAIGERLDRALAIAMPDLSRTQIQKLIKEGDIQLNGQPVKSSLRLEHPEQVLVTLPEIVVTELKPEAIPLDIRYEDDDILLINKPAGMVVHPAVGHETGTLVHAVLAHCPDLPGIGGEIRPGIVHRLDKDTSGLMLVAKNDKALRFLQKQFKERTIEKTYMALVEGDIQPPTAFIDAPIGRDPRQRKKMAVIRSQSFTSRSAQTSYQLVTSYEAFSLIQCQPHTGRTHQIRVHLAFLGYPIVGDTVYGRRKQTLPLGRHFLHAAALSFLRPSDKQHLSFEAELPADLQAVLDNLATIQS